MKKILTVLFAVLLSACTASVSVPVAGTIRSDKNVKEVLDSVCMITVYAKDGDGGLSGSCWAVSDDELISAGHVCEGIIQYQAAGILEDNIQVSYLNRGGQLETKGHAEVVEIDGFNDVCLLVLENHGLKPLQLAAVKPEINEKVFAVGGPLGLGILGIYEGTITASKYTLSAGMKDKIVASIPSAPGMSGSAVVNKNNEVVGILIAGTPIFPNLTIITPANKVQKFLEITKIQ